MLRTVIAFQGFFNRHGFLKSFFLCIFSAILLTLSFPKTDFWILAWFALVPFLLALDGKSLGISVFLGYLTGITFFCWTLYWFIHVTLPGAALLIAYLAVYFAIFSFGYFFFQRRLLFGKIFLLPALWVSLEFIRGHLLSGFGWVSLGHSQYKNLPFIQIADITGAYGISFLVAMVNVFLKEIITKGPWSKARALKDFLYPAGMIVLLLAMVFVYGIFRLLEKKDFPRARVTIVQGNVAQELKWESGQWPGIMQRYLFLTRVAAGEKPDIIIWPETAFPGFIWESPELFEALREFVAKLKIPLLLGVVTQRNEEYYNSALLIDSAGNVAKQHDKLHLVPFGEYIPLRRLLPFLSVIVPIGDFTPGAKYTLFPVLPQKTRQNFSVLICFEDTVPKVSRQFTKEGAHLLVNITNDAWFQDTKAPFIHLQAALFRAVENRRSLVRSTNTGVSCFIDPYGRIQKYVEDKKGQKTYTPGHASMEVLLSDTGTFYTKHGDIFTYLCFGSILMGMMRRKKSKRRNFKD